MRRREAGEPLHRGSVIRLEAQLREGLVVVERGRDLGVARGRGVQAAERVAGPAPGGDVRAAVEQLGLPVAPARRRVLQDDARARSASLSTTGGTRPGIRRAASRSAAASVSVRRAGAIHSSATRSRGSACLTTSAMPGPRTASTVPETPPASSSTVSSAPRGTTPRATR